MNRFSINEVLDIVDNITNEEYEVSLQNRNQICDLLNTLDNSDLDVQEMLLYELSVYKNFSERVLQVLNKYHIKDLDKLDRVLFEQRLW
jgi:hypothetical protein